MHPSHSYIHESEGLALQESGVQLNSAMICLCWPCPQSTDWIALEHEEELPSMLFKLQTPGLPSRPEDLCFKVHNKVLQEALGLHWQTSILQGTLASILQGI